MIAWADAAGVSSEEVSVAGPSLGRRQMISAANLAQHIPDGY